jgi:M6 family metalloprotease-like protein
MKKLIIGVLSVAVLAFGLVPAQAATKYVANQRTLASFSSSATGLSTLQRSQVEQAVEANAYAEKFICTGIRYYEQAMSVNITVRKRAKAACDYAKELNPELSTWYQTAPTKARSYAGKVLLTIRTDADLADLLPPGYVETEAIDWEINPNYKVGKACGGGFGWQVLGMDTNGTPAYLKCSNPKGGVFRVDTRMVKFDPGTKKPLVPLKVPAKTLFGYSPNLYISPQLTEALPVTTLSTGAFDDYAQCKVAEDNDGSADKSFGFPLPVARPRMSDNFKILVVPVQFTDHKTSNRPADDMADVVSAMSNFYKRAASVPVNLSWTIPETYYQMDESIDSFNLDVAFNNPQGFWGVYRPYVEAALALADDKYDFSTFDAVIIEEPRSVTDEEHGSFIPVVPENGTNASSDDGLMNAVLVTGNDQSRDIANWIHEFGHLLGLPDRNWNVSSDPGFGIMFGWYGAPEMAAWSRWQLGILQDKQVDCKTDTSTSTHLIRPVAWSGEYQKAGVIPVSENEVIVLESRRRQGYDALLGKESEGAYVYRIDTSAKMYQPDTKKIVDVVAPSRVKRGSGWAMDASLKLGESVTSDGWTITVKETGAFGDVIEVKKG